MSRELRIIGLAVLTVILAALSPVSISRIQGQTAVFVEAIGSANVRTGPGTNFAVLVNITGGTRYSVVGRAAKVPWLFINFGDGRGWVFNDLVKVFGSLDSVPFIAETTEGKMGVNQAQIAPTPTSTAAAPPITTPAAGNQINPIAPTSTVAATIAINTGVFADVKGELNVRFGPGVEFPRIGILPAGVKVPVLRRHTLYPWVEIASDSIPGGRGWVFKDAVVITGNVNGLPATGAREFGYPTLTPTQDQVVNANPNINGTPVSVTPDARFKRLGVTVFDYLLTERFEPQTKRQASAYMMDLRSGAALSLVPGVAYSGMSLIKIPILVEAYRQLDGPPTDDLSTELAEMMICSNNDATNAMLGFAGGGDMLAGTGAVTKTMQQIGLKDTFIVSPIRSDPRATAVPVGTLKTTADQKITEPDPFNQSTPADLGLLLNSLYNCAKDGTGPLMRFNGQFTITECRQMIRLLSSDKIGVMIEAGVPESVQVAHKHGWIDQTMGDAGIVFSPGGDYILVVMMSERPVLVWTNEFGKVSEIARAVYNYFNPTAPQRVINPKQIPETCTLPDALMRSLKQSEMAEFP